MKLSDIIKQYLKEHHISQSALADKCGINKGTISLWMNEKEVNSKPVKPSMTNLSKLASGMGITLDRLVSRMDSDYVVDVEAAVTGYSGTDTVVTETPSVSDEEMDIIEDIRMLKDWEIQIVRTLIKSFISHEKDTPIEEMPLNYRTLPYYAVGPAAGSGNYLPDDIAKGEMRVADTIKTRKADFVLRVDGHSMEPEYMNGDTILIQSCETLDDGMIGVFTVDGSAVVKQYQPKDGVLHSLNPEYPDIPLDCGDVRIVGKVLGKV